MNESLFATLTGLLFAPPMPIKAPTWGREHIHATVARKSKRMRTGGKVYGMNGPRAVARRKRQIERAKAKAAAREKVTT